MTYEQGQLESGTEDGEELYEFLQLNLSMWLSSSGERCSYSWFIQDELADKRIRWGQGARWDVPAASTQWTDIAARMITYALKHLEAFPTISGPIVDDTELLTGSRDAEDQQIIGDHG